MIIDYLKRKYLVARLKDNVSVRLNLSPRKKLKRGTTNIVITKMHWESEHENVVFPPRPDPNKYIIFFD